MGNENLSPIRENGNDLCGITATTPEWGEQIVSVACVQIAPIPEKPQFYGVDENLSDLLYLGLGVAETIPINRKK